MSHSVNRSTPPLFPFPLAQHKTHLQHQLRLRHPIFLPLKLSLKNRTFLIHPSRLQSSGRPFDFPEGADNLVADPRNWSRSISSEFDLAHGEEDDESDEEGEDRSLDLLVKFVQNMFKKVSRRARKAVRSVLPVSIPSKLVGFSVDGVIILAFFWVLKAFLEVVCTLGSVVFVSVLLIRVIWTAIIYLQEIRNQRVNEFDAERHAWNGAQPAS